MKTLSALSFIAKDGVKIKSDSRGNNTALICPKCKTSPVLITIGFVAVKGNCKENPATCSCGANLWIDPSAEAYDDKKSVVTIDFK